MKLLTTNTKRSYASFVILSIIAVFLLNNRDSGIFERFIGGISPVMLFILAGTAGWLVLIRLSKRYELDIFIPLNFSNIRHVLTAVSIFSLFIVLFDLKFPFPEEINILFPASLLFYPAIAFFVEIVFHLIPILIITEALKPFQGKIQKQNILKIALIIAAVSEPLYHVFQMLNDKYYQTGFVIIIGIHILFINLFQVYLYKRYSFLHMYLFRFCYYMVWHVVWGILRLEIMFS